jgi:hypothetical protein
MEVAESTRLHGATFQKNATFITAALRILHFMQTNIYIWGGQQLEAPRANLVLTWARVDSRPHLGSASKFTGATNIANMAKVECIEQ